MSELTISQGEILVRLLITAALCGVMRSRYTVQLRIPPRRGVQGALEEISALPGVERVSVMGLRGEPSSMLASPAFSISAFAVRILPGRALRKRPDVVPGCGQRRPADKPAKQAC